MTTYRPRIGDDEAHELLALTHMTPQIATLNPLTESILREYEEMPGLKLTKRQVQRMWSLDSATCDVLLEELQKCHVLRLTQGGRYALDRGSAESNGESP